MVQLTGTMDNPALTAVAYATQYQRLTITNYHRPIAIRHHEAITDNTSKVDTYICTM